MKDVAGVFGPTLDFYRFMETAIIAASFVLLLCIYIVSLPILKKVIKLEKENSRQHARLGEANDLLSAETSNP